MKKGAVVKRSEGAAHHSSIFSGFSKVPIPLSPFFAFVGFFLMWPILAVTIRSFQGNKKEWTLENFRSIIHGPYLHGFVVSLKLATYTAAIGSLIGGFLAFVIIKYAGRKLTLIIDSTAAVFANSGGVPLAFMFIAAFGAQGVLTKSLKSLGWDIYAGKFTLFSFTGLLIVYTFFQVPIMIIVFKPALKGLRKEWGEASQSLGANSLTFWRRVAIPILTPSFLGAFFLLFASGFSAYATARAMTVGNVPLVPLIIGSLVDGNVIANQVNLGDALAVGMVLIAVISMSGYLLAQKYAARWRTK